MGHGLCLCRADCQGFTRLTGQRAVLPSDPAPEGKRRSPFLFIFLVVVIDMMGVGLAYPLLPKLIQATGAPEVSNAAFYNGAIALIYAIAQFAFSPFFGNLSDAYGRRPVLLTAQAGLALDYFLMALAPSLAWIAVARLVSGIFGATVSTATAYVADISTPEDRARNFGLIGMAFGIGFIAGPFAGGLIGAYDIRLPFVIAGCLTLANTLFGWFTLPESLTPENRRPFAGLAAFNPFRSLSRLLAIPSLLPFMACFFLVFLAQRGLESIWILYAEFRFGWGVREAAFSLAFVGLCYIVVQGYLVGKLVGLYGEVRVVSGGYLLAAASLASFGLADRGSLAIPLIALFILGSALAEPALKALASKVTPVNEQGLLQGALSSLNGLVIIIAPFTANMVLAWVSRPAPWFAVPGAWFFAGAVFFLVAYFIFRKTRHPETL